MKHLKLFIICILVLTLAAAPFMGAQTVREGVDTVHLKDGTSLGVTKISLHRNGELFRFSLANGEGRRSVPTKELSSVVMRDGFTFFVGDSLLNRDNLISAPIMNYYGLTVSAEGVVPLKQEELKEYYGHKLYEVEFRPRANLIAIGGTMTALALFSSFNNSRYHSPIYYPTDNPKIIVTNDIRPNYFAVQILSETTLFTGLANCLIGSLETVCLYRHHKTMDVMDRRWARAEFYGGSALFIAGVGAIIYGAQDLRHNRELYQLKNRNLILLAEKRSNPDASPSYMATNMVYAGSIATSIGFTLAAMGGMRLLGWHKVSGEHNAEWSFAPTIDGTMGLSVRF